MRCAVVGHVEVVEFARVPRVPLAGEIARATEVWSEAAGGGAVIASQLAKLTGNCDFFTALGEDDLGRRSVPELEALGLTVHAQHFDTTRRALTYIDDAGERTITVLGPKLYPRGPFPLKDYDAVFFVAGNVAALRSARESRFVAATPREMPTLLEAGLPLDLLCGSGVDPGERYPGGLDVKVVVATEGANGGIVNGERYEAVPLPGPIADTYGAGDSFAATLCFALARGDELADAIGFAAEAGAAVLTGNGPYERQIRSV